MYYSYGHAVMREHILVDPCKSKINVGIAYTEDQLSAFCGTCSTTLGWTGYIWACKKKCSTYKNERGMWTSSVLSIRTGNKSQNQMNVWVAGWLGVDSSVVNVLVELPER